MREQIQAENIAAIVDRSDPSARLLIFAGWSHIAKQAVGEANQLWMAARFMQLTGIEPFSIDLVSCVYAGQFFNNESSHIYDVLFVTACVKT